MSDSVGSLLNDVLENNRKACKSVIAAYRVGGVRVTQGIGVRWERVLKDGPLNKTLRVSLVGGSGKLRNLCNSGIEKVSHGADRTLERVYDTAIATVEKVGDRVVAVENPYAVKYFGFVEKAALPSVKLARDLSQRMADGVETAYARLAPKRKAPRKVVAKAKVRTRGRAKR
jgi:hypothetical protein